MALAELQEKFKGLLAESETIAAKAALDQKDTERLEAIVAEGNQIKAQIQALKNTMDLGEWGKQTGNMLQLAAAAGGATVHGIKRDGTAIVEIGEPGSIFRGSDGDLLIPEKQYKALKSAEYRKAMSAYIRSAGDHHIMEVRAGTEAIKVLQEGLDVSGGFVVPEDIQNRVIQREPTPTIVSGRVTRLTTSRDVMVFPKITYTTDNTYTSPMRVTWTGEVPASTTVHNVTEPTFGQARIPIYTAMMSIPVTNDMIEDSAFDIMGWIASKFGETLDLLYDDMILNGAGSNQPLGILNNSTAITNDVHSGAASVLTGDGLVSLAFNLPPQYDRNGAFVMNKTNCAQAIFKLKDGEGRYLWSNLATEGGGLTVPKIRSELLGYPVVYTEFMPNIAANAYPIIFGDLSGYFLVQRVGLSITVARELKIETNQVLVVGRVRFGGDLVEDWRLRLHIVAV